MMLPNLTKIGILIDFKINQDFIEDVLCINKNKPMTLCNGKCYLSQQLKDAEEQEEKRAPTSKQERIEVVYYYGERAIINMYFSDISVNRLNPAMVNVLHTSSFIADVFRPPKLNLIYSI